MAGTQGRAPVNPVSALHAGLRLALPELARTFHDPWWIIGSAAMALAGVPGTLPQDIDVLCGREDAGRLRAAWSPHLDALYTPRDEARFRSAFSRFIHLPIPLEAMGGLEVQTADGWQPLHVGQDMAVDVDGVAVRVPTLDEQRRILRLFGRAKDLAKAERITAFLEQSHVA